MQENNPYDFITNPSQHTPKSSINFGGGKNKIIITIVFAVVTLIVLFLGISFLLSISKANNEDLITIRANQTELIRIIELGNKDATDTALKNRLASLQALVSSDESRLTDLMKKRNIEVTKIQLNSEKNEEVDSALESAKQQSNYDEVLLDEISNRSNEYYNALKSSLSEATTNTEKDVLNTAIDNLKAAATSK